MKLRELEVREKEMSLQLKLRELEAATVAPSTPSPGPPLPFDVSKHIRFVPPFQEKEVDKYFLHFEKVATSLVWPKDVWMVLLQSVLIGKAREVYSAMSVEQSGQYDNVKQAILKAYELVPEAYHQNFQNCRKQDKQTYREFARDKEALFDHWCASKEVVKDFEKLRQLVLVEEFKSCLPNSIKTYIDEQKADSLQQASVLANDYSLTHSSFSDSSHNSHNRGLHSDTTRTHADSKSTGSAVDPQRNMQRFTSGGPICNYCKRRGHVISECRTLEKRRNHPTGHSLVQAVNRPSPPSPKPQDLDSYRPFVSEGRVSLPEGGDTMAVKILRDTGATQSLIASHVLPLSDQTSAGASVLIQGVGLDVMRVPLHQIHLQSDLVSGPVVVAVRPSLPVKGVSLILGNDLAGGKVQPDLQVISNTEQILCSRPTTDGVSDTFPACVVTRAAARRVQAQQNCAPTNQPDTGSDEGDDQAEDNLSIAQDVFDQAVESQSVLQDRGDQTDDDRETVQDAGNLPVSSRQLIADQESDQEVNQLAQFAVSEEEAGRQAQCFYLKSGVLMRKWRPRDAPADEEWQVVHQIIVPRKYREEVLSLAHESPMAGHLGVNKTYSRILTHFYWPHLRKDVSEFCKCCHVCQKVGKPNQTIPVAPLKPIPVCSEPFSQVIIDCVGPLPKTKSGNQYLLTIMCRFTRFPKAIPLRNIPRIAESLVKFFTLVGLPSLIQSDQGSNFMSSLMQQVTHQLGIKQCKSSAYHPETQGALERFHQTLKTMIRAYCSQFEKQWDQGIHLLLFAVREAVQESLGFSPFELVFGRTVCGPLKLLKEGWLTEEPPTNLLDQVSALRTRLTAAGELAQKNLKSAQTKMKCWYDKKAKLCTFNVGDKVLVLLPLKNHTLQARYSGPYLILKKVNDVDYVINMPDRRKTRRLCHVNMLKPYWEKAPTQSQDVHPTLMVAVEKPTEREEFPLGNDMTGDSVKLKNSGVLANLEVKMQHLTASKQTQLSSLLLEFADLFPDVPKQTTLAVHDVDVGDASPIKQHPYQVNPLKLEVVRQEIEYMLANHIIEPSQSQWSSPCVLISKGDGSYRFCTDFHKVNLITKADSYPIPRVEDCIDKIGGAEYVSKFDLLKGYWQVPLTPRAKEVTAFVTPTGFFQYKVMPFGLKNAPATF